MSGPHHSVQNESRLRYILGQWSKKADWDAKSLKSCSALGRVTFNSARALDLSFWTRQNVSQTFRTTGTGIDPKKTCALRKKGARQSVVQRHLAGINTGLTFLLVTLRVKPKKLLVALSLVPSTSSTSVDQFDQFLKRCGALSLGGRA